MPTSIDACTCMYEQLSVCMSKHCGIMWITATAARMYVRTLISSNECDQMTTFLSHIREQANMMIYDCKAFHVLVCGSPRLDDTSNGVCVPVVSSACTILLSSICCTAFKSPLRTASMKTSAQAHRKGKITHIPRRGDVCVPEISTRSIIV